MRELLEQGKSDDEIRAWMVARYGDFILFRPRFIWRNAWLWSAPLVLLAIGVLVSLAHRAHARRTGRHGAGRRGRRALMVTFIVLAAALTLAGVLAVAVPLLRGRSGASAPDAWAALGAAGLLIVGSALLYAAWSNWPWRAPAPGSTPQTMVAHLARQLEHDPNNSAGWLMLGRSYLVLQEYPLALRAYERADRLSGGRTSRPSPGRPRRSHSATRASSTAAPGGSSSARWSSIRTRARRCSSAPRWPSGAATCSWPARASPGSWP